ncbi:class I SAM-dependent methyltransferase [Planctomycetota bacterium]|nr:class I SAM-dependent methyltransferase [Planctomycetota bacterium]
MTDLIGTSDESIADRAGIPVDESRPLQLEFAGGRLQLRDTREGAAGPIYSDPNSDEIKRRIRAGRELPLLKAICGKLMTQPPPVIDATAGLGRDTFVLAFSGCDVLAIEKNRVVASLLQDGLDRSRLENLTVQQGDALEFFPETADGSVVYFDPMFPARSKSAAVKKEMQYLQLLELPEADVVRLIQAAFVAGAVKVVLKRPAKSAPMSSKPNHSIGGKTVRFDVYLP